MFLCTVSCQTVYIKYKMRDQGQTDNVSVYEIRWNEKNVFCVFQVAGCHAAPVGFSPSLSWQQHQVGNFSDVRQVKQ